MPSWLWRIEIKSFSKKNYECVPKKSSKIFFRKSSLRQKTIFWQDCEPPHHHHFCLIYFSFTVKLLETPLQFLFEQKTLTLDHWQLVFGVIYSRLMLISTFKLHKLLFFNSNDMQHLWRTTQYWCQYLAIQLFNKHLNEGCFAMLTTSYSCTCLNIIDEYYVILLILCYEILLRI